MIKFYEDASRKWRWQIKAENGKVVGSSSQGFSSRAYAEANLDLMVHMYNIWSGRT